MFKLFKLIHIQLVFKTKAIYSHSGRGIFYNVHIITAVWTGYNGNYIKWQLYKMFYMLHFILVLPETVSIEAWSVSSISNWSRNLVAQSEASFVLTAHTKTIERDWNWRPIAPSISAILARSVLKFRILTSI
jgi:hypothetical protein